MAKSRPYIILSAAMTVDGKIATKSGDSKLSSKKDKIRIHKLRSKVDGILVGIKTVQKDNPLLTVRYDKGKNPIRIILDSKASISTKSRIIKTCHLVPTILIVSQYAPLKNLQKLKKFPLEIIQIGQKQIDIKRLLEALWKKNLKKILLEGGGAINWSFLKNNYIDEIIITISPYLVGGEHATSLVGGKGFNLISQSQKLKLNKISTLKNEIIIHYYCQK